MSSKLSSNTSSLQSILETVNNLPDGQKIISKWSKNEDAIISGTISSSYTNDRVTIIKGSAFTRCADLTAVSFPMAVSIGENAFFQCTSLDAINFPKVEIIKSYAFLYCRKLPAANFPMATNIETGVFNNCFRLSSLQLGVSSVCTLVNSNAFSYTPFAGYSSYFSGTPHIYVPASLITDYRSAENWSYFSSYFSSIRSLKKPMTFTLDGIKYQAEEDMTWAEWLESEYNTNSTLGINASGSPGCTVCNDYISYTTTEIDGTEWIAGVSLNDVINPTINYIMICNGHNTITPKINGIEYQAKEGMTWGQWINSEYNTSGCYIGANNCIYCPEGHSIQGFIDDAAHGTISESDFISESHYECISCVITFTTVRGHQGTYQAKVGMTWSEWINSEYNVDGFDGDHNSIITSPEGWRLLNYDETEPIYGSDYIIADEIYVVEERG